MTDELNLINKSTEIKHSFEIRDEVDGEGKKVFKNEPERAKELHGRLNRDEDYKLKAAELVNLVKENSNQMLISGYLSMKFRSYESISRLGVD